MQKALHSNPIVVCLRLGVLVNARAQLEEATAAAFTLFENKAGQLERKRILLSELLKVRLLMRSYDLALRLLLRWHGTRPHSSLEPG